MPQTRYALPLPEQKLKYVDGDRAQQSLGMSTIPNAQYGHVGFPPVNLSEEDIALNAYTLDKNTKDRDDWTSGKTQYLNKAKKELNNIQSLGSVGIYKWQELRNKALGLGNTKYGGYSNRAKVVQALQEENPELFQEHIHRYTKEPKYTEIIEDLPYNSNVPMQVGNEYIQNGASAPKNIGAFYARQPSKISMANRMAFPDEVANASLHEGIHKGFTENNLAGRRYAFDSPGKELQHKFINYSLGSMDKGETPMSPEEYMYHAMGPEKRTLYDMYKNPNDNGSDPTKYGPRDKSLLPDSRLGN